MLPTFVIGLREGLEAALVVSIIATFLRRNGIRLRIMWIGVASAVALSIAVGVGLQAVERALPQAQQEGMETVIGAIAVVFVTGMVLWMSGHARYMKRELEQSAQQALSDGTAWALAVMVFLAVLKEGFETSVFLLATFQASTSTGAAVAGAVLGILAAVGIGIGIYTGGVRINLGKFFSGTSVFLIFVAAGLVLSALRTAHEAGWILIGQARTVDLSWLAPNGSIRAALITGVLGMPADPRVVELLGWALYLVPMLLWIFWPKRLRPSGLQAVGVHALLGGALLTAAVVLAVAVRPAPVDVPSTAGLADGGTAAIAVNGRTATLEVVRNGDSRTLQLAEPRPINENGADTRWQLSDNSAPADRPGRINLNDLAELNGGRLPVGLDLHAAPGPYAARWTQQQHLTVDTRDGGLVAGQQTGRTILTLTGGGLTSPRTITVTDAQAVTSWQLSDSYRSKINSTITAADSANRNLLLWRLWLPIVFVAGGLVALARGTRARRRLIAHARDDEATAPTAEPATAPAAHT